MEGWRITKYRCVCPVEKQMRFITILWRNDVFNDPGAHRAGAEERPFKLSEKGGWEDWRLFSAELLCLWKAARVRLERPQRKLDICIAFLSVKVTTDREAPREKHKHTHAHPALPRLDATLSCSLLSLSSNYSFKMVTIAQWLVSVFLFLFQVRRSNRA